MAVSTRTVSDVHWFNWITYTIAIKDDVEIICGTLDSVKYNTDNGVYELYIGTNKLRYVGSQSITFGTPADASQALYGVPLNPQTP